MDMATQVQLACQRSLLREQFCFCCENVLEHLFHTNGALCVLYISPESASASTSQQSHYLLHVFLSIKRCLFSYWVCSSNIVGLC